ncbi:MAG: carboxypeptidase-like regulatory domain-containing protein [Gemmatimonadetes bacterium]|nr:carboxypeptidase-like regulatory domain-containing protein [Gemmatimonadota bacterium]
MFGSRLQVWLVCGALGCAVVANGAQAQGRPAAAPAVGRVDQFVGLVVDVIGKPMADIEVFLSRTDRAVRTDARGIFRFEQPPVGPHVVVGRSIGYVPYQREVIIGSATSDTVTLVMRRYPRTLSTVEITAKTNAATADAALVADRLVQMKASAGRLYTREQILELRPYSVAELVQGVPGILLKRGQGEITAVTTRSGVGVFNNSETGAPCQLQFYLNTTPLEAEGVAQLDPLTFRSVEVYPQTVLLPGLPSRPDRCGAIVINTMRR